jgi:pheromone shutdown protein TraB
MIEIIGTSHISSESVAEVQERIQEMDDGVVAVELDQKRLYALRNSSNTYSLRHPVLSVIKYFQRIMSRKTGISPGTELLTAVDEAEKEGLPIALIDQDIETTVRRFGSIPLTEKVKLIAFLVLGLLLPIGQQIDLDDVPDDEFLAEMLLRLEVSFPHFYTVLIEERNQVMAHRLLDLEQRFGTVVAFVGAGHASGIRDILEHNRY